MNFIWTAAVLPSGWRRTISAPSGETENAELRPCATNCASPVGLRPASNHSGRLPMFSAFCADTARVTAARATLAGKNLFGKSFILKFAGIADAELELAAAAVEVVMVDGNAVVQPQRAEMRDVQPQAQPPVVAETGSKRISGGVHRADVVERSHADAGAIVFFKNGNAVFQRAKPVSVAAGWLVEISAAGRVGVKVLFARPDVAELEAAQIIKAAKIITVVKRHVAAGKAVGDARPSAGLKDMAVEESGEKPVGVQLYLVIHFVAGAEFGIELGGEFGTLAVVGQLRAVARVVGERTAQPLKKMVAGFGQDRVRDVRDGGLWKGVFKAVPAAVQINAHVFERVTDAGGQIARPQNFVQKKRAGQRAGEADLGAGAGFVVNIIGAFIIQLVAVKVNAQYQFAVEEPRFDEGKLVVLLHRAQLDLQADFFAAAGEVRRVEQVKIALRDFREGRQLFHRTETGADAEVAGVFFLDVDDEIFPAGNRRVGRFGIHVHLVKILQVFQALLADFHAHHFEHFAGRDVQFAADDLVLGLEVAVDLDFLDVGFLCVANLIFQIHRALVNVRHAQDAERVALRNLDVSAAAVKILDGLGVLGHALGREPVSRVHGQAVGAELSLEMLIVVDFLQPLGDFRVAENFAAGDLDGANLVLPAFEDVILHVQRAGRGMLQLHVRDGKIQIAVAAVKIGQRVAVGVKIILLVIAAARQPGKHPAPPRLDFAAQLLLRKRLRPDEINFLDLDLGRLVNVKRHGGLSRIFHVAAQDKFHLRVGEAVLFIQLFHLLHVGEQLQLVQRLADLDGDFFLQLVVGKFFAALDFDFRDARARLHRVGHNHAAVIRLGHGNPDVLKLPRAVKRMHVILCQAGQIGRAGLELDVRADEVFADGRRADELDVHAVNLRSRRILRPRGGRAAQQQGNPQGSDDGFHFNGLPARLPD